MGCSIRVLSRSSVPGGIGNESPVAARHSWQSTPPWFGAKYSGSAASSSLIPQLRQSSSWGACAGATLPGADVFYAEGGKIIVTLESAATTTITGQLDRIAQLEGVLAATLVYHEITLPEASGEPACS